MDQSRDLHWGKVWAIADKIWKQARENDRYMSLNMENFSKHPAIVFGKVYKDLQPDCLKRGISMEPLIHAIAEMEKSDFEDRPLGELYVYAYSVEMNDQHEKEIRENILKRRKKLNLSQAELAEKVDCTQKDISRWEKGEFSPSAENLKKLAEALDCRIDDLA